jgi:hypothetical protein
VKPNPPFHQKPTGGSPLPEVQKKKTSQLPQNRWGHSPLRKKLRRNPLKKIKKRKKKEKEN